MDEQIESILFQTRSVGVYRIPPRPPTGHKSGDWKVSDKLADCRLRVVALRDNCIVKLEDMSSGALFAQCPVANGRRNIAVEQALDSSRYFVLVVEDPTDGKRAFLGIGFSDRNDSFDFNVALTDHEKRIEAMRDPNAAAARAAAATSGRGGGGGVEGGFQSVVDDGRLMDDEDLMTGGVVYRRDAGLKSGTATTSSTMDYSLKEGQKIHINLANKPKLPTTSAGFDLLGAGWTAPLGGGGGSGGGGGLGGLLPPPPAPGSFPSSRPAASHDPFAGLESLVAHPPPPSSTSAASVDPFAQAAASKPPPPSSSSSDWVAFD